MNIVQLRDKLNEIIAEAENNVYLRDRLTVPMYVTIRRKGRRRQDHYAPLRDVTRATHEVVTFQGEKVVCMVLGIDESQVIRCGSRTP